MIIIRTYWNAQYSIWRWKICLCPK